MVTYFKLNWYASFLLLFAKAFHQGLLPVCDLKRQNELPFSRDGDITIGTIFSLHLNFVPTEEKFTELPDETQCKIFRVRAYRFVRVIIFALDEISKNFKWFPNTTLGFRIYDGCFSTRRALGSTIQLLSQKQHPVPNFNCHSNIILPVIIGDEATISVEPMALMLGLYRFPQLLHYLKNVHFKNTGDEDIYFDQNGDPPARYDILNWQISSDGTYNYVDIGHFDNTASQDKKIVVNDIAIQWNQAFSQTPTSVCSESCPPGFWKAVRRGEPICCFDCLPCPKGEISNQTDVIDCTKCADDRWPDDRRERCIPKVTEFLSYEDPLGITLTIIPIVFSITTVFILTVFVKKRDTPIVKANNRELSYLLLLALTLCFLCSLVFIGKPMKITCMARQPAFGIIFSVCVSSILAKTITVVIAFSATNPNSKLRKWVGSQTPMLIVFICSLFQTLLCFSWLLVHPSFPQNNIISQEGKVIIECNEGSVVMFYCMLAFLGFLACVSFNVAFLARKLPDSFNEARYITFSMIVFISVWLSFIPAHLSTQGKYVAAVEIFAILASSAGLLGCIFIPKCYIILFRSEKNTREHMTGKAALRQ
ncbi:vomeronasal type-2 receptor 26-like [Protopterus annectens]|uniref:vomeronasal type-2 receptor 26-like n=1 Tax=Protopterus annectens TaxID=7888 RepID=UPI001CFC1700|nr:vomeronasal type-2 receptor 26-like [Protopterus annectens]